MEENKEKNIMCKTIIVTGGSKGIGAEIVRQLAKQEHQVVLNYNHSETEAKQIKTELEQRKKQIEIFKADVSRREEVSRIYFRKIWYNRCFNQQCRNSTDKTIYRYYR